MRTAPPWPSGASCDASWPTCRACADRKKWSGFGGLGGLWKVVAIQNPSKWQVNVVPNLLRFGPFGCWLDYVGLCWIFVFGCFLGTRLPMGYPFHIMGNLGKGSLAPRAALEAEVATPPQTLSPESGAQWGSWKRSRQPLKMPG